MANEKDWTSLIIERDLKNLENDKQLPGWFSVSSISNIPYIAYPGMNEDMCIRIHDEAQHVLRYSRNINKYKEVAITFSFDKNESPVITKGDENSVSLFDDEKAKELIESANKSLKILISLHNHPNNSIFSVNDLFVFTENKSIKIMEIVDKNGNIAFLMRPDFMNLEGIVSGHLLETVPDYTERREKWINENPNDKFSISKITTVLERRTIIKESIIHLEQLGVDFSPYINQEKARDLVFTDTINAEQQRIATVSLEKKGLKLSEEDFLGEEEDIKI